MTDEELKKTVIEMNQKIDAIYDSQERVRKHSKWTFYIMVAFLVLPLLGLLFAIPTFMAIYSALGNL